MKFQLRPILSEIKELYSKPISPERFREYLSKLQGGNKGDMALPIGGFNPMAKNHVLGKIEALELLEAESIIEKTIAAYNSILNTGDDEKYQVVLNIADDLKGGWTNHYTTDYDSKFKLNAFERRNFCVPFFWTSENYTEEIIKTRTLEYMSRTIYWSNNPKPVSLEDHFEQEVFVASQSVGAQSDYSEADTEFIKQFYSKNRQSDAYDRIFNFFYGKEGSQSLGYKEYGIEEFTGFHYAKIMSAERKT